MRVLSELVATRLGAKNFAREIKTHLAEKYPNIHLGTITGDPAGDAASQTDEQTVFHMLASEGLMAKPASSNDSQIRREAVATPLSQLIDGQPALVISPSCVNLRKAMSGGYHYRRVRVSDERYEEKPNKNMSSHIAESLQYLMMGLGIGREVIRQPDVIEARKRNRAKFAEMEYDMYNRP